MRAQRPPGAAPAIVASAESLPLDADAIDAAMACITIHHWDPRDVGLAEMRRVARGSVVVLTFDLDQMPPWQLDYLSEGIEVERPRFGSIGEVARALGGETRIEAIPTPADCRDGFFEAFWNRPEALLDPNVRASQSLWPLIGPESEERIVTRLAADLESGLWDERHGYLRKMKTFNGSLRLVVSQPE